MTDIWSGVGVDIAKEDGEWLYQVGTQICGPMPQRQVVEKLLRGELELETPVARAGSEFHPIQQVQAFAPHLAEVRKNQLRRTQRQGNRRFMMLALPVVLGLVGVGIALRIDFHRRTVVAIRLAQQAAEVRAHAKAGTVDTMHLVALVSLGEVKIGGAMPGPRRPRAGRPAHVRGGAGAKSIEKVVEHDDYEPDEIVSTCQLTQQDIFGTLKLALGKLNVCVDDEKKRDTDGLLPPILELQFVVRPSGKVVDFLLSDRHYRTGPLNNCLVKVFTTIEFPTSNGAACPITIPIKISKS